MADKEMKVVIERPHALLPVVTNYCPGCAHGIVNRLVAECLDELLAAGYHVGLATSSRRVAAERNLKTVGLFDKFGTVTFGEDVAYGKPDPEIYLLACERAGFAPEECAVVEDSRNGCVSGITAGCHVFVVPDIVPLPQDVVDGCEAVLNTLFDLTAAVKAVR